MTKTETREITHNNSLGANVRIRDVSAGVPSDDW